MTDQAQALRRRFQGRQPSASGRPSAERIIGIASGKGGVGKSNLALNLAVDLQSRGNSVFLLDVDLGMANIGILAGVNTGASLTHVVRRARTIEEVIVEGPGGIRIIPGSSGTAAMADLSAEQRQVLLAALSGIEERADYLVIDHGAGVSKNVLDFLVRTDEALVVATTEPTSVADAYGMIKALTERQFEGVISVVINRAPSVAEAKAVAQRLVGLSGHFLKREVHWGGFMLEEKIVGKAVLERRPFVLLEEKGRAARAVSLIADRLEKRSFELSLDEKAFEGSGVRRWFERILS